MKRLLFALLLVSGLTAPALAVPTIYAGNHILLPETPGQVFPILVDGAGEMVAGLDLFLVVNGGIGPAPVITAIDIIGPGTVFNPNNVGQFDLGFPYNAPGLQPSALTTTAAGTVEANGVLAFITVDSTGVPAGIYSLSLTNPDLGPTDFAMDPGNDAILVDGVFWGPEPSTLVLAGLGSVGLFAVAWRRRRQR